MTHPAAVEPPGTVADAAARQLPLPLHWHDEPTLDNFEVGTNAMALRALRDLLAGAEGAERMLCLWGEAGSGKTHLLRAACAAAQAAAQPTWLLGPRSAPSHWPALEQVAQAGRHALLAVDDVDACSAWQQQWLFGLYNSARQAGAAFVATASQAPAALALREDVRTRLAWGLGLRLHPLDDAAKQRVLARMAAARGLTLREDLSRYILDHHARDMGSLVDLLHRLEAHAVRQQRAPSIALLKSMQAEVPTAPGPPAQP